MKTNQYVKNQVKKQMPNNQPVNKKELKKFAVIVTTLLGVSSITGILNLVLLLMNFSH